MAVYHLTTKPVSRASGRSAPAASAYRSAEVVHDRASGETWDYTRKQGVEHTEIVLPRRAAQQDVQWARNREQLWNAAERAEKRVDARVAREWEVALPHELGAAQRIDLARTFASEIANRYGCAVDVAVHEPHRSGDHRNHHAHLMATTRTIEPGGLGRKTDIELGDRDRAKKGLGRGADEIGHLRERWATLTNERLQELGVSARIDHRSLKDQGIEREPTVHLGPAVTGMERRGIATEVGNRVREEQRREMELKLEKAAALGQLEREGREVEKSILDLSGDLKAAIQERDLGRAIEHAGPVRHDPFQGLTLGTGAGGPTTDPFKGLELAVDRSAKSAVERDTALPKNQELGLALDRYARAWTELASMPAKGLPVLEHQGVELQQAGQALDRLRPEATKDLAAALTYEPSVRHALVTQQGLERTQTLSAALGNEARLRANPELRAERVVKEWKALEHRHAKLIGAEHAEARQGVEQRLRHIAREIKHDEPLGRSLQERSRSLGIERGSPLDRVLKAKTPERAQELSVPDRSRGLELGR